MNQFDFIIDLPSIVLIKDTHSVYINSSDKAAQLLGWKSAELSQGKTDYDIPSPAVKSAESFRAMDKKVLKSQEKLLTMEIQKYASGWKTLLVEKNILKNKNNEVSGIYCAVMDISNDNLLNLYSSFNQDDFASKDKTYQPKTYILSEYYCPMPLTQKQQPILFYLIRGRSLKEIANTLNITYSSIQTEINHLQSQFNCQSLSQLIEKAISCGYHYYLPQKIQKLSFGASKTDNALLTPRENDILRLLVRGKTAKEIARTYYLSPRTVEHYLENIKGKIGVNTKSALIEKVIDYFLN